MFTNSKMPQRYSKKIVSVFCLVYLFAIVFSVLPAYAQLGNPVNLATNVRNGGDAPTGAFYDFSSDGKFVVFVADDNSDGIPDLFSVPVGGGPTNKLSQNLSLDNALLNFKITPNGKTVLYVVSDVAGPDIQNLYSVSIQGGVPRLLTSNLVGERNALSNSYVITPDSKSVVFKELEIVRVDGGVIVSIFRFDHVSVVPVAGGMVTRLSPDFVEEGGRVESFQLSPDGAHIVYLAAQDFDEKFELFSVPTTGGIAVPLNRELVPNGNVFDFKISPDSNTVVYRADAIFANVKEIFKVPVIGGDSIKLNDNIVLNVNVSSFNFSADSQYVVYTTELLGLTNVGLYSVDLSSNTAIQLNQGISLNAPSLFGRQFIISPNSQRVVFSTSDGDRTTGLYSVLLTGGSVERLSSPPQNSHVVSFPQILSDSKTVVYRESSPNPGGGTGFNLLSVSIEGGQASRINPDFTEGGVFVPFISDIGQILFAASSINSNVQDLYYVPALGRPVVKVNSPLAAFENINFGRFGENKNYIFYQAEDVRAPYQSELFSVKLRPDNELCFPIKSANNRIAVVCL